MRVLIVEDDGRIARSVAEHLSRQRYVVDTAADGATAFAYATELPYEVLIADVMLPKMDGLMLCARLREAGVATPVLMLTARDTVQNKVDALDAGADDYLTKPFDLAELAARVRALARRGGSGRTSVFRYGPIEFDQASMRVSVEGRALSCTPTELAILEALLRWPRRVFSTDMLLERVCPLGRDAANGSIKTHVANLRRKIRAAGFKRPIIETLYGCGYRLADL